MRIEFNNLSFYPFDGNAKGLYHAIGYINLYDREGAIKGTIMIDVPKCFYDEYNQELIALEEKDED